MNYFLFSKGLGMKKYIRLFLFILFISGLIISCSGKTQDKSAPDANSLTLTASRELEKPQVTSTSTPTRENTTTAEPSPTLLVTPTSIPSPTATRISQGGSTITASNYLNLENYAVLGKGKIESISVSDDGEFHIIKTARGIYIYETKSLAEIAFFEDYKDFYLVPGKSEIVAVTLDLILDRINFDGDILASFTPPNVTGIGSIVFSNDLTYMAVHVTQPHQTRQDWTSSRIDIWDLQRNALISQLESDLIGLCFSSAFSNDGKQLISACPPSGFGPSKLFYWDIPSQSLMWYLSNEGSFTSQPFSHDNAHVATFTSTQTVVRQTSDGTEVGRVAGKVGDNPFSADDDYIVTSSFEQIRVWFYKTSESVKRIETGLSWPKASFSEDGGHILANDGQMAWRASDYSLDENFPPPEKGTDVRSITAWRRQGHLSGIMGVELLENDLLLIWGLSDTDTAWGEKSLWWWYPDQDIYNEIALGNNPGKPDFSKSKNQFAVCSETGLKIITIKDGQAQELGQCRASNSPVAFSSNSENLYVGSGILIEEIDIETGEILGQLRLHDNKIGNIISSDEGGYLFTASAEEIQGGREVAVWGLTLNSPTRKWFITAGSTSDLSDAVFTKNNENLVAVFGSEITAWRISDGWYLSNIEGTAVGLSQDGKLAAVGTQDKNLEFYNIEDWKLIGSLNDGEQSLTPQIMDPYLYMFLNPSPGIKTVKFFDDGRILATIENNDLIKLWSVP